MQQHAGQNTAAALNQPAQKDAAHQRGNALCQIQVQQRKQQGRGKNRHAAAAGAHNALQRPAKINFLQHSGHYTQTEITDEQIQTTGGQRGAAGGNAQPTGQQPAEQVARVGQPQKHHQAERRAPGGGQQNAQILRLQPGGAQQPPQRQHNGTRCHHNAQQPLRGHAESDRVAQAGTLHPHTHQGGNKNSQ